MTNASNTSKEPSMMLWRKYAEPPAEALKSFDNGSFKGTDISPMWRIRCLTEEFGPCGIGWYTEVVEHWSDVAWSSDIEQCVTTHVRIKLYYVDSQTGEWSKPVEAVGGNTMTLYSRKFKNTRVSDEAYKMAYTDAIGGACKMLGIGGSVYWERGYSKYERDYVEPQAAAPVPVRAGKPIPTEIFGTPIEVVEEPAPKPKDTREEADYRVLCLRKFKLAALDVSCKRSFGTDFAHTPVSKIKNVLPESALDAMEDIKP